MYAWNVLELKMNIENMLIVRGIVFKAGGFMAAQSKDKMLITALTIDWTRKCELNIPAGINIAMTKNGPDELKSQIPFAKAFIHASINFQFSKLSNEFIFHVFNYCHKWSIRLNKKRTKHNCQPAIKIYSIFFSYI